MMEEENRRVPSKNKKPHVAGDLPPAAGASREPVHENTPRDAVPAHKSQASEKKGQVAGCSPPDAAAGAFTEPLNKNAPADAVLPQESKVSEKQGPQVAGCPDAVLSQKSQASEKKGQTQVAGCSPPDAAAGASTVTVCSPPDAAAGASTDPLHGNALPDAVLSQKSQESEKQGPQVAGCPDVPRASIEPVHQEMTVMSAAVDAVKKKILIVYYCMYGHVEELAKRLKKGVDTVEGAEGVLCRVLEKKSSDEMLRQIASADGLLFGFPSSYGSMPAQMKAFFDSTGEMWKKMKLAGKPAGFFVSTSTQGRGEETIIWAAITPLAHHGMLYVPIGYPFGPEMFHSIRGGSPYGAGVYAADGTRESTEPELTLAEHQGKHMAGIVKRLETTNQKMTVPSSPNVGSAKLKIFIVFYSTYGHVEWLAKSLKKGVDAVDGVEGILYRVRETLTDEQLSQMKAKPRDGTVPEITPAELMNADGVLFGFPTRCGSMASQMMNFFDSTERLCKGQKLAGKPAGFFVSTNTQGTGQETNAWTAITKLAHHGMLFVPIGYTFGNSMFEMKSARGGSPYGAAVYAGNDDKRKPTKSERVLAEHQGMYMATIVKRLGAKS